MTQIAQIFICRRWVSSDSHVDGDWGVGLDRFTTTEKQMSPRWGYGVHNKNGLLHRLLRSENPTGLRFDEHRSQPAVLL